MEKERISAKKSAKFQSISKRIKFGYDLAEISAEITKYLKITFGDIAGCILS